LKEIWRDKNNCRHIVFDVFKSEDNMYPAKEKRRGPLGLRLGLYPWCRSRDL